MPNVSIIIPVKDGLKWLKDSIPIFFSQLGIDRTELLLLDSNSQDGLKFHIEGLDDDRIKIISVKQEDFNHGKTRNLGIYLASYEFIVFTVQDATPLNSEWLFSLIEPLEIYNIDAVCGQQVVKFNLKKNPVEWFCPIDSPSLKIIKIAPDEFNSLTPEKKRALTEWDNVNAAYRKGILRNHPFREVPFGEDAYWASDALKHGLKIAYTSFSRVDHYHHLSKEQFENRFLAEIYLFHQLYGIKPVRRYWSLRLILSWLKIIIKKYYNLGEIIYWLRYNITSFVSYNRCVVFFNTNELGEIESYILENKSMSTNNSKA
jgi:glycosyltransferase involved in cell wall biosynthesis